MLAVPALLVACGGSDVGTADSSIERVITSVPEAATSTSAPITGTATDGFPPPGLPLLPRSELAIGEPDLVGLKHGGDWLFALRPPSVLLRIDPSTGEVANLDVGLGTSKAGSASYVFVDDSVWVIGGPFRDTLVEVDPSSMTEVRRITLDDDHGIGFQNPTDELWLTTLQAVRPVDVGSGEVGAPIPIEVDPGGVDVDDGQLWVALPAAAQLARIDTSTGSVDMIDTEPGPESVSVAEGIVWVSHPPTASVSRIEAATGTVLGVTDLDIGGAAARVTGIPGIQATPDGLWAILRFAGSAVHDVVVRLDPATGAIESARTIQLVGNTWEALDGRLWFHRADNGSLIAVDVTDFDDAAETPVDELAAATSVAPTTAAADRSAPADAAGAVAAFERFTDATVTADSLRLGELGPIRSALLDLLGAQVRGELRVVDVTVDSGRATVTFDVVVEGDTVVLPGLQFVFVRGGDGGWTIDADSLCVVASGVGVPCP